MNQTDAFLDLSPPDHRKRVVEWLRCVACWQDLRDCFLGVMTEYGTDLCQEPDDWCIASHEAGGAWRPLFFHMEYQDHEIWKRKMAAVMRERRRYVQAAFHHGFPDEAEIHHEIETFLYFQMPLWHHRLPGQETGLESILDVAEHIINAVDGVPPWYDWDNNLFRSTYLGTRSVRAYRPFDYQEGNHWRFANVAMTAYQATSDKRYLDLLAGYARPWCRHIQAEHARGDVIRCSIVPEGEQSTEMRYSGIQSNSLNGYQVFYWTAAVNTAYDIVCGLLDVYRMTNNDDCRACAGLLIDQFFYNGDSNRPAMYYSEGTWGQRFSLQADCSLQTAISQMEEFPARMALRYDMVTAENRYKDAMTRWALEIDEERFIADQTLIAPLIASWYYTKDSEYLHRAFAMALRLWAVTCDIKDIHMCSSRNHYGSTFLLETCYLPITGRLDAGTRGNLPLRIDSLSGSVNH